MPELPEVETTRRGIEPHLVGRRVRRLLLRERRLRWPVADAVAAGLAGAGIDGVRRRAKYLLIDNARGSAIVHLGMSGSLRVLVAEAPVRAHEHWDLELDDGHVLRYHDPRRFGCLLWQPADDVHPLLADLGPEPFDASFDGARLHARARGRSAPVKHFLMDQRIVVGVGNIYAAEALFRAGIDPRRAAGRVSATRYEVLAQAVRTILAHAIERGGTTLRDFLRPDGEPGYFEQELMVYGRAGEPCRICGTAVRTAAIGQRSSYWCPSCQR
ncbi:MAG: bifunctional DNA-formamidopyrimidine glycosylase/DNA-(apurinic or apyrimidinic site) lyase [Xanthomonadales bacterium]|nr:Formamidopyrimidine-DNA glycosylase [Xanthomonadales bacterium]MCC6592757.1 bifunctional DNA-formamidopyrimidine glycosylase/DNA-(apurinic or apyrimidinic site) lyase [Xanthomonadales bacterium]MCE7931242.1 bifunctional DNA-formamidopyrimidine glycosylase/DNA-(apurinic or apyrimidinic site) lyase [Xanthomonadales bacterium PRO6]